MLATSTTRRAMFGLTILLVLGLVLTTQGMAQEGRPVGGAADKKKAGPPNDGQKRFVLDFDRTPWKTVFKRLAENSHMAFRSSEDSIPTGTFTFINPKVNGAPKAYTIAEIFDIVNDGLAPRAMLIRTANSFRVVWAGEPLYPGDGRGPPISPQITRLQEQIKALADKVETMSAQLREIEAKVVPGEDGMAYRHACQYVKASQMEKALRDSLGDPNDGRPYHIASDDRTNTMYVSGPPEKVEQARKLMAKYDVPQYGRAPSVPRPPTFQTYSIPAGNADAIAKILTDVYKSSATLRFTATSSTVLLVYGLPLEQMEIAALLRLSPVTPANSPDDVVRFAKGPSQFGRDLRQRSGPSRRSLEARLDRLIAELETIRREVRSRR